MSTTLLTTGLVCIIAAIVGGGLKAFGIEIPILQSGKRQVLLAIFGSILIIAGYYAQEPGKRAQPVATPLAAPKTPNPSDWPLIGKTTFTEEGSGWFIGSFPQEGRTRLDIRVVNGKYRWDFEWKKYIGSPHTYVISPYGSAVNFEVAVYVQFVDFTQPMTANLVFGSVANEAYEFMVSSNGEFALFISDNYNKKYTTIVDMTPITVKFEPKARNRMSVVVDEQLISCYLNSKLLSEYKRVGFTGGKVGLGVGVGAMDQGGSAIIEFDNFEFRRKP
jgi:hypothetical protein